ncbi:flocculation protein FLO11 [Rhagoletis pomonella]|uniref:flocculation protein FLO11 n=1 Tax=Rhagoletis pomonella TaxID=28610 RepID=UPI00177DFD12|nr:flocculation protein FLO11 [Rhagoletis pomonella]
MDRQASAFEYLCRVCAANTKGKNSVAECVYILKTPALKDKIEKFLYLTISEDDILPKVLCKACYRQVEATASLSKIAKHTQKVFRDFIFNTKSYLQAESSTSPEVTTIAPTRTLTAPANTLLKAPVTNFTAPATAHSAPAPIFSAPAPIFTAPASIFTAPASTFTAPPAIFTAPTPTPTTTTTTAPVVPVQAKPKAKEKDKPIVKSVELITLTSQPPPSKCSHKDDVILNVSVNDPLTRETQHKMITASRRQNSLDSRYTPKSIAQRGFTSTPKQPESITPTKKQTTSGVINFFPNRPQQVTTVTSGGYVIGCTPSSAPTSKPTSDQPASAPASAPPTNTLQQKRKNLKTALNNSKTSNSGQVSLLKVSQKAAAAPTKSSQPPKVVEPPTVLVEDDVPAEPLPEKMIIASTKQQKHLTQVTPTAPTAPQPTPPNEPESELQPQTEPTDLSQPFRHNIPDDILLGKVIKDGDLLKLILKALKWPVKRNNMEAQLERLRNSRFAHIMADPNLLQDADLTQIMGPYLGPVLQAAQMLQQQQQIAAAAAAAAVTKETELQVAGITTSLPYKLPAETSVQLVPASPEAEAEEPDAAAAKKSTSNQSLKRDAGKASAKRAPPKKVRKVAPRGRSASTFNSDEYAALNSTLNSQYLSSKSTPDIPVDLDPSALFTQLSLLSGLSASSSNEALLALLERQRVALSRLQQQQLQQQPQPQPPAQARRQRSNSIITVPASGSDFLFDTDDIILMEPDDCLESASTNLQNNLDNNTGSSSAISQSGPVNNFPVPQQVSKPMITRPIIKRRKTVIQASPARTNLAINTQPVPPAHTKPAESVITTATRTKVSTSVTNLRPSLSAATAPPQKKISKTQSLDSLNTIATQYPSNIISSGTQAPSNTTNVSVSEAAPTAIMTKATETALIVTASAATSVSSLVASTSASNVTAVSTVAAEKSTTRSTSSTKRQSTSKLALGQQLLEAICLQTIAAEKKDVTVVPAGATGARGSVQQIRSALKKSLQKAQEQQQQRNKKAAPATTQEENVERNVNIVREVVEQPRSRHRGNMPAGQLDVEEEINRITLVLQSNAKEDKKIEEADKRLTAAAPTRIPGIRRKIVPTTRNRRPTVTLLVADEIVDLVADEDNQDSADGKSADKDKGNEKDKEKEATTSNKPKETVKAYLNAASLATLQRSQKSDTKEQKTVTPMSKRGRNIQLDESDDDDDEDNKPLKPRTEKHSDEKQEVGSRTSTPASWQRSESATNTVTSARPSRVSKTMSRYYKGPDKSPGTPSRSTMATRSRFRN